MKQFRVYQSLKHINETSSRIEDATVIEAPLQININKESFTVVMRTPGNDVSLIRGLLYAEDVYRSDATLAIEQIESTENHHDVYNVTIPASSLGKGYLTKRSLLSVSSCGICGKQELDDPMPCDTPLKNSQPLEARHIHELYRVMQAEQNLFNDTGGSHACAIFSGQREFLICHEDIGRHNAVDKCIGGLLQQGVLADAKIMIVSGRVSYEIVTKAFFAKISIIIAVSACSSLAIDFAKEFGICLIGFCRQPKMTIYSNPQYILL